MEWYAELKSLAGALVMPFPIFVALVLLGAILLLRRRHAVGLSVLFGAILFLLMVSSPLSAWLLATLEDRYPPLPVASGDPANRDSRHCEGDAAEQTRAADAMTGELSSSTADPPPRLAGHSNSGLDPCLPEPENIEAVVVLAAGWRPDPDWPISSQLNVSSAIRLFEGVRLAIALPETRLILSGGSRKPGRRPPVAHGLAQAARDLGIAEARMLLVDTPLDTGQEARAVADVLPPESRFLLVTTAAHMPRAVAHFQRAGLFPIPAPTQRRTRRSDLGNVLNWRPSASHLAMAETAWHEYLGLLALRWEH